MNKYGRDAHKQVEQAMHKFKRGDLRSSSGQKVTKRDQAITIGLSEARDKGYKAPKK